MLSQINLGNPPFQANAQLYRLPRDWPLRSLIESSWKEKIEEIEIV